MNTPRQLETCPIIMPMKHYTVQEKLYRDGRYNVVQPSYITIRKMASDTQNSGAFIEVNDFDERPPQP